jgi:hypothetical protein
MVSVIQELIKNYNSKSFYRLVKSRPELKQYLDNWNITRKCKNINEQFYCIAHNIEPPKCKCGKKLLFNTFEKGYRETCGSKQCRACIQAKKLSIFWKEHLEKKNNMLVHQQNTCIKKYNVKNIMQSSEQLGLIRRKLKEKTGYSSSLENPYIQEKCKETCIKNNGVAYPLQSSKIQDIARKTFESRYGLQKMQFPREAWLKNNDNKNPFATNIVKDKIKNYWQLTSGVNYPLQNQQILFKFKKTIMERFHRENISQIGLPQNVYDILTNKNSLAEKLQKYSLSELSKLLGISRSLIMNYHDKHNLHILTRKSRSSYEDEISNWLDKENIFYKKNDRTICKPYELDFYFPQYNLAIEFDGLYYHAEHSGKKTRHYHENKYLQCKKLNIQLLTIFEDEWLERSDIIKKHIQHLCGKTKIVIGARKTTINEISFKDATLFLNAHHVQGAMSQASFCLGAYFNDTLCAVIALIKEKNTQFNICRYATNQAASYPGLFSKFLKYIHNNYPKIQTVTSIADCRWSVGNVYEQSGFIEINKIAPDYSYTDYHTREHKFNYRKQKLNKLYGLSMSLTESEMTAQLGLDRIWDCGKIKYKKDL